MNIDGFVLPILVGGGAIALLGGAYVMSRNYMKVPPSKLMVISGRKGTRFVSGGATLILPVLEEAWSITKQLMTVTIVKENVQTKLIVPVDVEAVAQLQLQDTEEGYANVAKSFLGFETERIMQKIEETMEGHIRAICANMTVEELIQDRESFNKRVLENAKDDLEKMGLSIVSFTIKDIRDSASTKKEKGRGYIESLYAKELAEKIKAAEIAEANAKSESRKATAIANQVASEQENIAQTKIAEYEKEKQIKMALYNQETYTRQAVAEKAKDIETAIQTQKLKEEQMKIELIQKQKQVEISERNKEIQQLEGEAEKVKMIAIAAGESEKKKLEGIGEAEAIKAKLLAEAEGQKQKLLAEAEGVQKKAEAYRELDQSGLEIMKIEKLPQIAEKIAEPLKNIGDKITIVQTGDTSDMGLGGSILNTVMQGTAALPKIFEAVGVEPLTRRHEIKHEPKPETKKKE